MLLLEVALERLNALILERGPASVDETLQLPIPTPFFFDELCLIVDLLVLVVTRETLLGVGELLKSEELSSRNHDLLVLRLADGALAILHDEAKAQNACEAHVLVVTASK